MAALCKGNSSGEPLNCHCFLWLGEKAWLTFALHKSPGSRTMWWRWRSQIGPQGGYEFPAGRAVGGGVHQFIRKQTMIRLCAETVERFSLVTTYSTWFPSPCTLNHIPLLASSPWETLGFLLTCPSPLMELLVGRCCYPWQRDIFGNQELEWKGQYFFCNQGAALIYFFTESFMEYQVVIGKNSQRRVMGKKAIQWPGKAEFLWSLPAVPLHPRNLRWDPSKPFFGEDTNLYI